MLAKKHKKAYNLWYIYYKVLVIYIRRITAMTEQKSKRVIVSITAGAVVLLVILLCVLVYQLISIKNEKNNNKELESQIAMYEELTEAEKDTLLARKQRWWIERRARELGYKYDGDIDLTD